MATRRHAWIASHNNAYNSIPTTRRRLEATCPKPLHQTEHHGIPFTGFPLHVLAGITDPSPLPHKDTRSPDHDASAGHGTDFTPDHRYCDLGVNSPCRRIVRAHRRAARADISLPPLQASNWMNGQPDPGLVSALISAGPGCLPNPLHTTPGITAPEPPAGPKPLTRRRKQHGSELCIGFYCWNRLPTFSTPSFISDTHLFFLCFIGLLDTPPRAYVHYYQRWTLVAV